MQNPTTEGLSLSMFESQYDAYLLTVRGLSRSTRSLHHHVVHRLLSSRFPTGCIRWSEIRFNDFVQFLTSEFARLHNRSTQTTWLMVLRSLLRYLSREGHLPSGWDTALPATPSWQEAIVQACATNESGHTPFGTPQLLTCCEPESTSTRSAHGWAAASSIPRTSMRKAIWR